MAKLDQKQIKQVKNIADWLGAKIVSPETDDPWFFIIEVPAGRRSVPTGVLEAWHESEPVTFSIRFGWDRKDSLHISGHFPSMKQGSASYTSQINPYRYQEKRVAINVSESKGAQKIAREIEKRFKDAYMVYYQRALETIQSHMEAKAGTAGTVERLQMASSGMLKSWHARQEDTRWDGQISVDNDRVSVRVYNGKVDIEMQYISEKTALKIVKVLGDLALAQSVEKEVA